MKVARCAHMLVLPAARPTPSYVPRPRTKDLLYQTLQRHLATFLDRARERDRPVPGHVERELLSSGLRDPSPRLRAAPL